MRSLTHTARGKLRTTRGYERALKAYKRELYARDYDQPNDVEALERHDDRNQLGKGDYWSAFRGR